MSVGSKSKALQNPLVQMQVEGVNVGTLAQAAAYNFSHRFRLTMSAPGVVYIDAGADMFAQMSGMRGEDGDDGFAIPGAPGPAGTVPASALTGPTALQGDAGDDGWMIPGVAGLAGSSGILYALVALSDDPETMVYYPPDTDTYGCSKTFNENVVIVGNLDVGFNGGGILKLWGPAAGGTFIWNSTVVSGMELSGGTNGDTRFLFTNGNGLPTAAISMNYSAAYDAAGTFSMQKRTIGNVFTSNIWGINAGSGKIWVGAAGSGTLNGLINVVGECQVQTVGTIQVSKGVITTAVTIDWNAGFFQTFTETSLQNPVITFTAPPNCCSLFLKIVAPASGTTPTISYPATVKGSPPTTVTLAKTSLLEFFWDGTSYFFMSSCQNV